MDRNRRVLTLFEQALGFTGDELEGFLSSVCRDDEELRREIEALLAEHAHADRFLKVSSSSDAVTAPTQFTEASEPADEPGLSDSSHHGRFLPGAVVDRRYRIVSLAGRGGMGEVYRADDLKLGHTVALKFLPREFGTDGRRLELFHNEVRLARQISHPNVCRVYDIGELDDHHFLSMEYVDGEDLRVLLRRIGRLPADKGMEIAQQLCAGLAAAHDRGVIHRDLKPANIMIDGRGQVRITDFGLAKVGGDDGPRDVVGTPAYMAPEQLADGKTSVRSDLYSLGLILHELFTGEPVYRADSMPELRRLHADSTQVSPSSLVGELSPEIDQVIHRCLQREPRERPSSVRDVATALPGGDPLAMALAAGDTPRPEVVAAAGGVGTTSVRWGTALLLASLLGLLLYWITSGRSVINLAGLDQHPQVLLNRAMEVVRLLGHEPTSKHSIWGIRALTARPPGDDQQTTFAPKLQFWYRQSETTMVPTSIYGSGRRNMGNVTFDGPPFVEPEMIRVALDMHGKLQSFEAIPPRRVDELDEQRVEPFVWQEAFADELKDLLSFSSDALKETELVWTPPIVSDSYRAWLGQTFDGEPVRVEVASFRGQPVYFRIMDAPDPDSPMTGTPRQRVPVLAILVTSFMAISACFAFRNVRAGRHDRVGAWRIAGFMFAANLLLYALAANHSLIGEAVLFTKATSWGLHAALEMWLFYVAFEPLVRRTWPQNLIGWHRILSGKLGDPLVGSSLTIGILFAVSLAVLHGLARTAVEGLGMSPSPPLKISLWPLVGTGYAAAGLVAEMINSVRLSWWFLLSLTLAHVTTKNQWLAVGMATLFWSLAGVLREWHTVDLVFIAVAAFAKLWLLCRFGLWSLIMANFVERILAGWPITLDTSAWYFSTGLFAILILVGLAVVGFAISVGGRRTLLHGKLSPNDSS